MNSSNNVKGTDGWLAETAEILGFSSGETFAISAACLFFSILASAVVIVSCVKVALKRRSKTTLCDELSFFDDSNRDAKTSYSPTSSLPTYDQCLQEGQACGFWWDDESTVLFVDGSVTPPPSFSSLQPKLMIT